MRKRHYGGILAEHGMYIKPKDGDCVLSCGEAKRCFSKKQQHFLVVAELIHAGTKFI